MGLGLDALDEDAVQEGGEGLDGFEGCGLGGGVSWVRCSGKQVEEGREGRCRRVLDDGGADRAGSRVPLLFILHDPGEGIERGVTYHDCGLAGDAKENWEYRWMGAFLIDD